MSQFTPPFFPALAPAAAQRSEQPLPLHPFKHGFDPLNLELYSLRRKFDQEGEIFSRWSFERSLDDLASALAEYLAKQLSVEGEEDLKVGCSLICRASSVRCYIGGASSDRRRMGFGSRYYSLAKDRMTSLTAFSITTNVHFVIEDLSSEFLFDRNDESANRGRLTHKPKRCELEPSQTKTFYCLPIPKERGGVVETVRTENELMQIAPSKPWGSTLADPVSEETEASLPSALPNNAVAVLRVTSDRANQAKQIHELLSKKLGDDPSLQDLFSNLMREGIDRAGGSGVVVPLKSLAALFRAASEWRGSEYYAMDQLTMLLQSMFESCEVSVFEAQRDESTEVERRGVGAGHDRVTLRLAATTALQEADTESGRQNGIFRDHFYRDDENGAYYCDFEQSTGTPRKEVLESPATAKTARAYYESPRPLFRKADNGSSSQPGKGEIEEGETKSFLAFAIPAARASELPYGVVRIVSSKELEFEDVHRELAGAVSAGLGLIWSGFPRNDALQISWTLDAEGEKEDMLDALSRFRDSTRSYRRVVAREFPWLLRKIFHDASSIYVKQVVGQTPGRVVLRVQQGEVDFDVECHLKGRDERYEMLDEPGWRESRLLRGRRNRVMTRFVRSRKL